MVQIFFQFHEVSGTNSQNRFTIATNGFLLSSYCWYHPWEILDPPLVCHLYIVTHVASNTIKNITFVEIAKITVDNLHFTRVLTAFLNFFSFLHVCETITQSCYQPEHGPRHPSSCYLLTTVSSL